MSLPYNELSSTVVSAPFLGGRSLPVTPRRDFEYGGVNLSDPSEGLQFQIWECTIDEDSTEISITAPNQSAPTVLYTGAGLTECSLTFDQNMRPQLAFVEGGVAKLRWFDTQAGSQVVTTWGSSYITPRISLDDKRTRQSDKSDVIFAYLRGGHLYYRQQRDRYGTERLLQSNVGSPGLVKIGMNRNNRLQFLMRWP